VDTLKTVKAWFLAAVNAYALELEGDEMAHLKSMVKEIEKGMKRDCSCRKDEDGQHTTEIEVRPLRRRLCGRDWDASRHMGLESPVECVDCELSPTVLAIPINDDAAYEE
jgi:hypothetical protein